MTVAQLASLARTLPFATLVTGVDFHGTRVTMESISQKKLDEAFGFLEEFYDKWITGSQSDGHRR